VAGAEEVVPGHSHQGHAFNEGPRQGGALMEGTGNVHLAMTTDWEQGQAYFDQGIGQLHGFWYYEAERSFRQIAAHDPECAMAYWGMAMANWENEERAQVFIEKAVSLMEGAAPHEIAYIKAQANYLDKKPEDAKKRRQELLRDLEDLIHDYPEDLEAKAFHVVRLWQFSQKGMPITSHEAIDALLGQIFEKVPLHPAHHYRIHLWDNRKGSRAIDSASKLGSTAPTIAHMWHMPGHIYSKLHRYEDATWNQQASARVDHAHMMEDFLLPDQIHNYAHNNEWLARNWVHLGNAPEALAMAKSLLANPRHPELNTMEGKAHSYRYGRKRLLEVLEKFELWDEVLVLAENGWLEALEAPEHEGPRLRLIALAHYHLGQEEKLAQVQGQIESLLEGLRKEQEEAQTAAREKAVEEKKKDKEIEKLVKDAGKKLGQKIAGLEKTRDELNGCLALLKGEVEEGLKPLEKSQRPKYALALQYLALGNEEKAESLSAEAVKSGEGQTLPLAAQIEVLHRLGKMKEAGEAFESLRKISSQIDRTAAPFARLGQVAKELALPEDWTLAYEIPADFGGRPDPATLGPLHWSPPQAPAFSLPDDQERAVTLASREGEPVLLIFYLGHGCLHCSEQLNALAARASDFENAELPILAISTDTIAELAKSQANYSEEGVRFPFPLVADPESGVFRAYGAHDDFEDEALHGTFLLDPQGRILWSDVSADPFMDVDFLLKESARLLRLHAK
jgi:peroxiredoxin